MSSNSHPTTRQELIERLSGSSESDRDLVCRAYDFAKRAHEGHKRNSGEPYFTHVAAVAHKLVDMGMGARTVAAGLLHDSIEDTPVTAADIKSEFDDEILFLVEGVTKLSSVRYRGTDRHNESLRKLFVAASQDIRVIIIKLNDRLHNMETLQYVKPEKQLRIARETLEIYAAVAHRLGMSKIRKELEDLAFPYVYKEEAERVKNILKKYKKSEVILEKERKLLQKRLAESGLRDFRTSFRVKGLYSMYHKLKGKQWDDNSIHDLLAMRVVVPQLEDCYRALGIVHEFWRPLPGRMKDYIASPKPNGYQSLHTVVATHSGTILEIQIRTEAMHREAELGVASHILYKEKDQPEKQSGHQKALFASLLPRLFLPYRQKNTTTQTSENDAMPADQQIPHWIAQIGKTYRDDKVSAAQFIEDAESDFFSKRIFVFTPKGDVVDLPLGSTAIDFAYAIHSEVGDKTGAVKINHKLSQLDTELQNGDIVEVDLRKNAHPTEKWLQSAKTALAKRRIRVALEQRSR